MQHSHDGATTDHAERFRELELRRRRDEAELLALVAVAQARGVCADDGHLTTKGVVAGQRQLVAGRGRLGVPQGSPG